ncbi:hypothetical protein Hypma_012608 [Hypsizygus marmoreus]|uniref:Uncharacterized protein n=1 Tax=Hypsizygus marmoreus TaxID=39966 RepID=A0A369JG09_HYPMA|nr:hypothetical protein Hypma_012608 [Hypsizygus marmoreus]
MLGSSRSLRHPVSMPSRQTILSPLLRLSRLDRVPPLQRLHTPPTRHLRRLSAFPPFEAQMHQPSLPPPTHLQANALR